MIKIYLDTANLDDIRAYNDGLISGLTTNPSLAKKAGIKNYKEFIQSVLKLETNKPVSFEVLSNDPTEMVAQANQIAEFGKNVYVKLPIKNTDGKYCIQDCYPYLNENINLNITAVTTFEQVKVAAVFLEAMKNGKHIISIFAGRIADCGVDPEYIMAESAGWVMDVPNIKLLWASPREVFNIYQAERSGADIITCTPELIKKYVSLRDKNLEDYATETAQMFFRDAQDAGLTL